MPSILWFILEFAVVSLLVLGAYQLRPRFRLYGVVTVIATIQMVSALLASSFYWELAPGVSASPGSVVLFAATLAIVLVAYARGGARDARVLLYTVIASNVVLAMLGAIFYLHIESTDPTNYLGVPPGVFASGPVAALTGIAVLYLDQVIAIALFASLRKRAPAMPFTLRFTLVLSFVLALDTVLYLGVLFNGVPEFGAMIKSGVIAKSVAGLVFGLLWGPIVARGESGRERSVSDVMRKLLFRKRVQGVIELALSDPESGLFIRDLFDITLKRLLEGDEGPRSEFGILRLEIERFHELADALGSTGRKRILQELANEVLTRTREEDMAFRYADGELALILPSTDREGCNEVAARLAAIEIEHLGMGGRMHLRTHVAVCPEDGTSGIALRRVFDQAM